ncbi:MAG: hypothetical protein VKO64_11590 [Candidatus Sericytochromatia bacterium]|nr:hypothetical protein [Candidatus Sericytochromatia bacterium]
MTAALSRPLSRLALALAVTTMPLPVLAAGLESDASDLHREVLVRLADQLIGLGYVQSGERVWWEPEHAGSTDSDADILRAMLARALMMRGVVLVDREPDAQVRLEARMLRGPGEVVYRPELVEGRPGPSYTVTHRLVVRSVESGSKQVRGADVLVVQLQPFAPIEVLAPAGAPGAQRPGVPHPVRELQGVGLAVSNLSGSGFSYRRWTASGLGYQISGFPYVNGPDTFFNAGGQVMQSFFEAPWGRGYGLGSAGAGFGSVADRWFGGTAWNLSVGGGLDLRLAGNLVLCAQLAYSISAGNRVGPGVGAGAYIEF